MRPSLGYRAIYVSQEIGMAFFLPVPLYHVLVAYAINHVRQAEEWKWIEEEAAE